MSQPPACCSLATRQLERTSKLGSQRPSMSGAHNLIVHVIVHGKSIVVTLHTVLTIFAVCVVTSAGHMLEEAMSIESRPASCIPNHKKMHGLAEALIGLAVQFRRAHANKPNYRSKAFLDLRTVGNIALRPGLQKKRQIKP